MEKYKFHELAIEITRRCNKKCVHCMRGDAQNVSMTTEVIDRIFADISDVTKIAFTGGEPLLEIETIDYFVKRINSQWEKTRYIEITTNGTICDKRIIDILESFCLHQNGRYVILRISNDDFHKEEEFQSAYEFYKHLVDDANLRIGQIQKNSIIEVKYLIENTDYNQIYTLTYSGRAKSFIDEWNKKGHKVTPHIPILYGHRLKIINGTIPCILGICSNGNLCCYEDIDYDSFDRLSLGNILNDNITDIINNHNNNCMVLCSETDLLTIADNSEHYLMLKPTQKAITKVRKELYSRILELRYQARQLFPNVSASDIIETLHFPYNLNSEMKLYKKIYEKSQGYNNRLGNISLERLNSRKDEMRLISFLDVVLKSLQDHSTRNLLNDILTSSAFQRLKKLNDISNVDNSRNDKNYACFVIDANDSIRYCPECNLKVPEIGIEIDNLITQAKHT